MYKLLDLFLTIASNRTFKWMEIKNICWKDSYIKSKFINIIVTDKCNLSCIGCRGDIKNVNSYELPTMEYDTFVSIVNNCIESGIYYFDLTPVMGEILLVKNIHKYLDYLENHPSVLGYLITTNGTINNIPKHHKKINVSISLYGTNNSNFNTFTNKNIFSSTLKTFESLLECECPIEITIRNKDMMNLPDNEFRTVIYKLLSKTNISVYDGRLNDNRGGIVNSDEYDISNRKGVCPCGVGSGGAIRNDGNYYYCAFNDFNKKSFIGNVSNGISQLRKSDVWVNVVNEQVNNTYNGICKSCTAKW